MTLSFDHLFNQGPMGDAVIAASPPHGVSCTQYLSWRGRGESREIRMVSDLVSSLKDLQEFYPRSGCGMAMNRVLDPPEPFAQKLIELSDLWHIYCGRRVDAYPWILSTPLHLHVSARVYELNLLKEPDPPAWRFLCFDYNQYSMRLWKPGEHVPVVACFDAKAPRLKQLMEQFGHALWTSSGPHITLRGTSEEEAFCLEIIIEEVWADADRQFDDGWQQLYMLTCLKRYFSTLWNVRVPEDYEFTSDDDYHYESHA